MCIADRPERTPQRPHADPIEPLIAAYTRGDASAWDPLFDRLAPRLLGFFLRCLHDPELAEQHVQATFLELHRSRRSYRRGTPALRWVFRTASRVRIDGRSCLERPDSDGASQQSPARGRGESPRDRQVREAIDNLSRIERTIIHLHRFERMSVEEITEVLGWTEAAVRRHLTSAYLQLRMRLWTLSDDGGAS